MTPDPGLPSSSEQKYSQDHNPSCESRREHEVFLSHSGKQKKFVHDLFNDFLNCERFRLHKPFFDVDDESLRKGEVWIPKLIKAARECKVAVLLLTEDFLTSKWPMLELLHFVDARKTTNSGIKLLPVFYGDLVPAHLSDATCVARWKEKWETIIAADTRSSAKPRQVSLTIESCLEGLHILKSFNGTNDATLLSFESLRKSILSTVISYLPSGYEMDPDVAGGDRLCKIISEMFQKSDERDSIQRLGLFGMGGSGKSTMCSALCRYFGVSFNERVYHLQMGSNDRSGLSNKVVYENRQKELLGKLFRLSKDEIDRIPGDQCKSTLKHHFEKEPVFLALDDMRDDSESCEEAKTYMSYLSPGSKIVFTARSRDILKYIDKSIHCERIPSLNEEEALCLFLRIAIPDRQLSSLDTFEGHVLRDCLRISFFPLEEAGGSTDNSPHDVSKENSHYHPLALRAIAYYFKKQNSKHCGITSKYNILECGLELLKAGDRVFVSPSNRNIFEVLGIGFQDLDPLAKQLFIDVALYAPRQDSGENIFNWLLAINQSNRDDICWKLQNLRELSFLNCEDRESACEEGESVKACVNVSMHDLYREYAKKLVNKHENEISYKYGVYNDHSFDRATTLLASSGWTNTPRVGLRDWKDVINENEWSSVSVIHLFRCETITSFSIGPGLTNLRELKINGCSRLEQLQWTTPDNGVSGKFKLCFVVLLFNESLKKIPDFSGCSDLRKLVIRACSTLVEPISLRACSSLRFVHIAGENAPEVRSLRSCLKLEFVRLAWKASHTGLVVSDLPSLLKLKIAGAAVLPKMHPAHESMVPHGPRLFQRQFPDETVRYKLTGISQLTVLTYLQLNYIPLGRLPEGLNSLGSSLKELHLRGCLLSEVVDFSGISSLQEVSIAQTNVREIRSLSGLKELERLDCRFNFRLQKIPDLRPAARLQTVLLDQCPELTTIPSLPASCFGASSAEDAHRKVLAMQAFRKTTKSVIPPPLFALWKWLIRIGLGTSRISWPRHDGIQCDGCTMHPLIGPRFKLKDIQTKYDLCRKCLSNKTHRNDCNFDSENSSPGRFCLKMTLEANYDLCFECFNDSGCDEKDFYCNILQTIQ